MCSLSTQDGNISPEQYLQFSEKLKIGVKDSSNSKGDIARDTYDIHEELSHAFSSYAELKRSKGVMDFHDLISLPLSLLEASPAVAAHIASRYKYILVDEYQVRSIMLCFYAPLPVIFLSPFPTPSLRYHDWIIHCCSLHKPPLTNTSSFSLLIRTSTPSFLTLSIAS